MSKSVDATASMPEATSTSTADLGEMMRATMEGRETSTVSERREVVESEPHLSSTSDLQSLIDADADQTSDSNVSQNSGDVKPENGSVDEHLELKVKGYKEPVKISKNWEDPKVQELLNKGLRFDRRMQELAKAQKELQAKLDQQNDYADKVEVAERVQAARALMAEGYSEHALSAILGDSTEDFINSLVEERIQYQNASPEERLRIDLQRKERQRQLSEKQAADRIAKLEAQINARSEQAQEAEFSGYLEGAKSKYDLAQWIDDADTADYWNDMLNTAAMRDIIKLQRQREASGQPNITDRDIRRAYAQHVQRIMKNLNRQSEKIADTKVTEQAEVAKRNAQVASTKNYGQERSILDNWQKSDGSMSSLVDMLRRGGRGPL